MNRRIVGSGIAVALAMAGLAGRADVVTGFRYGADERIRQEYFDHIPVKADPPAFSRGGENDYIRFRTRLWAEVDVVSNVTFRARLVNESRDWFYPDPTGKPQRSTSQWPEEWVFDNLYLEVRGLLDNSLDLRVGRQEMMYGNGRVIYDGTPGDGSRTLYFNAAKATWRGIPKTGLDFFGIYDPSEDQMAIHPSDRDLTGYTGCKEGVTESGAGLYATNGSIQNLPFEAYLIYKHESEYDVAAKTNASGAFVKPAFAWQTLDPKHKVVETPDFDVGTVGFRVMPVFSDTLSGNLEVAGQYGTRDGQDQHGYMVDAYLLQKLPGDMKPAVKAGVYCLSGDHPKTADDEGWDPLWARYPQTSELLNYSWDSEQSVVRWSNLIMPSLCLTFSPTKAITTKASVSYLAAFEADGSGGGKERGWLESFRTDFTLAEDRFLPKDKLAGHVMVEVMEPGDYYKKNDTAVFARWEITYAF